MIVWGGWSGDGAALKSGGRYDPASDTWSMTSLVDAPAVGNEHAAVWTGREMIVWGGAFSSAGGIYTPANDTWRPTSLLDAPPGVITLLVTNGRGLRAHGQPAEVWCYLFEMRERPPVLIGPGDGDKLMLGGRRAFVAFVRRDELVLSALRALNPGALVRPLDAPGLSGDSPVYALN